MASEKTPEQIVDALRSFPSELQARLDDLDAQVETSKVAEGSTEVHLVIRTIEPLANVEGALKMALGDWGLYGERFG